MRCTVFSTKGFERDALAPAAFARGIKLVFLEPSLSAQTAELARGSQAVCLFVNDKADAPALERLAAVGVRFVALRSAGFNHVDLDAAGRLGLTVARVPAYSPYAVAEHATGLILALNRKLHRAFARAREHNFALDGLMGFDMHGKTVGVVGTGRIGEVFCRIMTGFGCRVLACDPHPSPAVLDLGARYASFDELCRQSDIISLHCPLTPETHHLVNADALARMKPGVMLINTSRGGVVDTRAVINALKSGHLGALGIDVYEEEGDLFFRDLSSEPIQDDVLARLLTFPNVVLTAHQAFFTREALDNIVSTTLENLVGFERGTVPPQNLVTAALVR